MSNSPRATRLTVLEQILVRKRAELLTQRSLVPLEELEKRPRPERRSFREALESRRPAVISEIKKASPSAGVIAEDFNPASIAKRYEAAGAAALSVLTDEQFFQGSIDHLQQAREAVKIPVLRKDFTLDRYHLLQASAAGADAILLIVAALSDFDLHDLMVQAEELQLDALVEVHDEAELDRALAAGAEIIGVNNRNLKTLEVSLDTSLRLAERIPASVLAVSESGIRSGNDVRLLTEAGYRAFLIGESLMKQADPGQALASLLRGPAPDAA